MLLNHNRSPMGRIRNALTAAFNQQNLLPKIIAIILEDDIIKDIDKQIRMYDKKRQKEAWCDSEDEFEPDETLDTADMYQRIAKFFVKAIAKVIRRFKEAAPKKALKDEWPHTIWITPTTHMNYKTSDMESRNKFTNALNSEIKLQDKMSMNPLRQIWDPQDMNLFLKEQQRMTPEGLTTFWSAVDKTIKFCDFKYFTGPVRRERRNAEFQHSNRNNNNTQDRYRWQNANYIPGNHINRRRLPTPPHRRC